MKVTIRAKCGACVPPRDEILDVDEVAWTRCTHQKTRSNDDDSSDGRGHNADTQAPACAARGRSNKAEGEVERGG